MKSDFVSFATHQLRTPLTGIRWLLELALQEIASEQPAALIADAKESAERLIRMVNDLLAVSRLENGRLPLRSEEMDLVRVTHGVLKELERAVQEKRHKLTFQHDANIPPALADSGMFRQILINLMTNAINYTPADGEILVELRHQNGRIRWSVTDNGIGIPEQAQPHLFEKFFRADNAFTLETEGTGLGLCIARLIVEQAGGTIVFHSQEGKGSTFGFEMPVKEVQP
jgi:two-component system phosphate regulon sensor histidine kinase PhoR